MEKPTKPKNRLFNFLSSAISFHNLHFSPTQPENHTNTRKGFKISIVPPEARRRNNLSSKNSGDNQSQEPTSPKISCMGEIKNKKEKKTKKNKNKSGKGVSKPQVRRSKSDVSGGNLPEKVPALGQIRRFVSGREKLQGFDWTAQVAPE
ncbi:uncharacterized protein At1g76070-like [Impatiens glandulifera]|uniref:uncharacterized protein At1g76070-like n=1 Tax=Impatiens glandulifera TaxID=253017 RepID=UPI001FB0FF65|nr:uncharacterized protein At1g76070-like [Impatiens glandulifera]